MEQPSPGPSVPVKSKRASGIKLRALPFLMKMLRYSRKESTGFQANKMSPREYLSYVLNDVSLEERESLMSDERLRSKTFLVNWPHDGNLSGVKMAQAGFYCVDDYDRVQCVFCHGSVHNWVVEDNPMTKHIKLFPSCPFVKGFELGIKVYKNENNTDKRDVTTETSGELLEDSGDLKDVEEQNGMQPNEKGVECADKEYKNDILLAAMYEVQPGRMDTADSGLPSASCKTCYKKTSQVVQAMVVGLPCGHLIYSGKCIQDEKLNMDRNNAYKASHLAHQHYGGMETTCLVPDNLQWIFNPSLHGISSAVPSPPSYLTDVLCYAGGHFPDTRNPLSMDLLQKLGESYFTFSEVVLYYLRYIAALVLPAIYSSFCKGLKPIFGSV